jgi:peptidoglycan hydrolase-like protein with peptidoglycan-binding domain
MYRGFSPGAIDGLAGPNTIKAIKDFNRSIGKPETDQIDPSLMGVLLSA